MQYSERPKSEHSDFGVLENRPVPKRFGYQTVSDNQMLSSGFRTFGPFTLQHSAFKFFTRLDRFILKKIIFMTPLFIKRSSLALKI